MSVNNIKKLSIFKTSDGTMFEDKNLAVKHEMFLDAKKEVCVVANPLTTVDPQSNRFVELMLKDPIPYRNILTKYIQRAGIKPENYEVLE
jgi:hypothetical protein